MASVRVLAQSFVWVKLVSDAPLRRGGTGFVKLPIALFEDVADLTKGACVEFSHWGVAADEIELYLATASGVDEPSTDSIKDALSGTRLQSGWSLARAGIAAGSWLLAHVPPQPAAASAGGAFDIAAAFAELKTEYATLRAEMKAAMTDTMSFVSPTGVQYEVDADKDIDDLLERFCCLRVLLGRRSIAARDEASGGIQWDGRFAVTFTDWSPPVASPSFYVYGGGDFTRPRPVQLRQLSPTKHVNAQYFAVFEYTMYHDWYGDVTITLASGSAKERKGLPLRLEQRLTICLERFNAAGNLPTRDILQVVSVVGVVSPVHHATIIEDMLAAPSCTTPLLAAMFRAHRFVHFHKAPMLSQGLPIALAPAVSSAV